jgi:hypothetical protein
MYKTFLVGLFMVSFLVAPSLVTAHPQAASTNNQYPHPEVDKTDIYAIPLDSSEIEEEDEINELEAEEHEYQKQK